MRVKLQITSLVLLISFSTASAQSDAAKSGEPSSGSITASASGKRVRFTAPSSAVQIRLEAYNSEGKRLSDNEVRGGNVLDWLIEDDQAGRLPDGTYLCVVTVKSLSGKITQRIGSATIEKSTVSVQAVSVSEMTAQQAEAIGPLEQDGALTILKEDDTQTTTVIAHNGDEGLITRGLGALSFRVGDFYSGRDTEQMRLTAEGNLGIGIAHPQVRLDVDGLIRANQGVVFPDGTIQYSASSKTLGAKSSKPGQPSTGNQDVGPQSITATQNRIPKFTDNAGALGDSAIVDVNGNIGIGASAPQSGLDYRSSMAPFFARDIGVTNFGTPQSALQLGVTNTGSRNVNVGPSFLFFADNSAGAKSFLGRVSGVWENPTVGAEAGALFFQVRANSADVNALTERMRITAAGNVGIGTTTPASRLDVAGNFNISGNGFVGGGIGLGTSNLISPLTIQNTSFTYGWTQTNGTVSVSSYVDPQGGWLGTRSNHPLYFFTNGGLQQAALLQNGNFGIGTVLPSERLHINNGSGNAAALVQTPTNAFAQYQMKSGAANTWTVGTQDNFANGGLLFRYGGTDLMNIQPSGGITQPRDKGGMVKAMVFVNGINGSIVRCYNGISGASIPTCGFSGERLGVGVYRMTFPFQVDDRFFSLSTFGFGPSGNDTIIGQTGDFPTPTSVRIFISESTSGGRRDGDFCFIVY